MTVDELADCWMFIPILIPSRNESVYNLYCDMIRPYQDNPRINAILTSRPLLGRFVERRLDEIVGDHGVSDLIRRICIIGGGIWFITLMLYLI